ncbi:MAG: (2Fe-2S)-binding protein [Thermodesulfobacteriota bacterium]|nr:(2Fe-2S)-binding protein [Thermodesulfobacteriota bacterium]
MKRVIALNVNGKDHEVFVDIRRTLLEVLREELGLTGTKNSCDMGACGSCTVLVDGMPYLSCLTLAVEMQGKKILTIEGMADGDKLHPIQEAFYHKYAVMCGFCTPGMVMSAKALLDANPKPTVKEIKTGISGHVCRCMGGIGHDAVEAIKELADSGKYDENSSA